MPSWQRLTALLRRDERQDRFMTQVMSGVAADVVIALTTFGLAIFTARAFGPENRGVYALSAATASFAATLSDFGLPTSVMAFAARSEAPVGRLHAIGLAYAAGAAALLSILLFALTGPLVEGPLNGVPPHLLPLLGIAAGCNIYSRMMIAMLTALKMIRSTSLVRVGQIYGLAASAVLLVLLAGASAKTAVLLVLAGQVVQASLAMGVALSKGISPRIPVPGLFASILSYGARSQIGGLSRQGLTRIDYYILNSVSGTKATGIYSVAVPLAEGLWLAMGSVYRALVGRLGDRDGERAREATGRVFRGAAAGLLLLLPLLIAVAPIAIPLMFGDAYRGSVVPFMLLVIGVGFLGLYHVLSAYVLIFERRPLTTSAIEGSMLLVSLPIYVVLISAAGATGAAAASAIAYFSLFALMLAYYRAAPERRAVRLVPSRADLVLPFGSTRGTSAGGGGSG